MIMKKLWSAIEKRRLVFVALDDELLPSSQSVASVSEIRRHADNQEVGPTAGDVKDPGQHGGGGGLAMGTGDYDRSVSRDEIFLEQLRHRTVGQLFIEDIFHLRISAGDDISHHAQIRCRF